MFVVDIMVGCIVGYFALTLLVSGSNRYFKHKSTIIDVVSSVVHISMYFFGRNLSWVNRVCSESTRDDRFDYFSRKQRCRLPTGAYISRPWGEVSGLSPGDRSEPNPTTRACLGMARRTSIPRILLMALPEDNSTLYVLSIHAKVRLENIQLLHHE